MHLYFLRVKYSPKNLVFSGISPMATFTEDHLSEGVKVKRPPVTSENLTYNQP